MNDGTASLPEADDDPLERVRRTEILISNLLRTGVLVSVALIVAGTILTFVHHSDYFTSSARLDELLNGSTGYPTSIGGVIRGLGAFEGRSLVMLGLLVLIATPVVRVGVSIVAFIQLGDRTFVAITSCVLILLLLALALGKASG
jgi:uncharacterized membrane protein